MLSRNFGFMKMQEDNLIYIIKVMYLHVRILSYYHIRRDNQTLVIIRLAKIPINQVTPHIKKMCDFL